MEAHYKSKLEEIISLAQFNPFAEIPNTELDVVRKVHHEGQYPISIRLNQNKPPPIMSNKVVPWCANGRYLEERPVFTLDPLFHAGAYYVQEASSMFIAHAFQHIKTLMDSAPIKVLDLCAAPGGKSTLIASLLSNEDLLVSNEVIQSRASILVENMSRWGQMNTWVTHNDPKDYQKMPQTFDVLLIDAPCTGSGLWRRDATAMDEWSTQHVKLCAERQHRILIDSFSTLKEGGYLMYATCSFSPEEDEAIMDFIIDNFEVETIKIPILREWNIVTGHDSKGLGEGYHFYPWKLAGEGFFLTVFKKTEQAKTPYNKKEKYKQPKSKIEISPLWKHYLDLPFEAMMINDDVYAFHPAHIPFFHTIKQNLYIKKAGVLMGNQMNKDVVPHHELALCIHLNNNIPCVHVSKEEALLYLKKEPIKVTEGLKGWHLVRYENLGLGWGKWMPGRMNNYLPKNWRIRMDIN